MADICIAYAREDRATAEKLNMLLSPQYSVWWDDKIIGRFGPAIESEISSSRCVVGLLSSFSRGKDTFTEELRLAQKNNVSILLARLDDSDPPYPFGSYSYTELHDWQGHADHPGYRQLLRRIAIVIPPGNKPHRPSSIAGGRVHLPGFFFSVSSHETQLTPAEALKALRLFGASPALISAYDLVDRRHPNPLIDEVVAYRDGGGFVLVDSGNYEASHIGTRCRWKPDDLKEVLAKIPHDWAFCFDVLNSYASDQRHG